MTVESFSLNAKEVANSITVTPAAAEHFAIQLQKKGKEGVRISLKESGCTGYMYVLDEVDEGGEGDFLRTLDNDVTLYVSSQNIAVLKDLEIDYVQKGVNKNLVLNNPNIKDACGCGESFSV